MPTRRDAQGVMSCELATYGIPIITSDLSICHEILDDYRDARFADEGFFFGKINVIDKTQDDKLEKFIFRNTVKRELELFENENW